MRVGIDHLVRALTSRPSRMLPREGLSREAAVATVVRERDGHAEVLLIRRAENPRDPWSGHMAFPGGRHEAHDADLLATALRETREEVGLDLRANARLLGPLDELEAVARGRRTGLVIRPYLFVLEEDVPIAPRSTAEVAEVLFHPLTPLVRGDADTQIHYAKDGFDLRLPAFDVAGRTVWGLTHEMLRTLFERLRASENPLTPPNP